MPPATLIPCCCKKHGDRGAELFTMKRMKGMKAGRFGQRDERRTSIGQHGG
jgi:hypothetical protein